MTIESKNLKGFRKSLGLSIEEFAEPLGFSASYISMLETGKRPITLTILKKLKQVFHIKPDRIIW